MPPSAAPASIFDGGSIIPPMFLLLLLFLANPFASTPLGPPPRARQFIDKRSSGPHNSIRTTVAELIRLNPLLASLAMFRDDGATLREPVDITTKSILTETKTSTRNVTANNGNNGRSRIGRRKGEGGEETSAEGGGGGGGNRHSAFISGTRSLLLTPNALHHHQHHSSLHFANSSSTKMDNFEPLYQIFNATLFDMAIPLEMERRGRGPDKGKAETQWTLALPWGMAHKVEQNNNNSSSNYRISQSKEEDAKNAAANNNNNNIEAPKPLKRLVEEGGGRRGFEEGSNELGQEGTLAISTATANADGGGGDGPPPFEVTESLQLALSTAPSPAGEKKATAATTTTEETLVGQEEFPMGELMDRSKAWKYPWERERGEQQQQQLQEEDELAPLPPSSSPTLPPPPPPLAVNSSFLSSSSSPFPPLSPSVMPGANFYVDQHVSHGPYGREPEAAPDVVYDPNVLESRYGYSGMLPQRMPNGQLVRFGGRRTAHFGVAQQQRNAPVRAPSLSIPHTFSSSSSSSSPSSSFSSFSSSSSSSAIPLPPAAAVFFIPAPPRLSMARAIPAAVNRIHGRLLANRTIGQQRRIGYWPMEEGLRPAKWEQHELEAFGRGGGGGGAIAAKWPQPSLAKTTTTTMVTTATSKMAMVPMGGNHLKWVPAEKLDQLSKLETFEEFGDATKFPCYADPPELILADSPAELALPLSSCFRRVRQCVLHMARPLERRVGMPLGECVQLCVGLKQCNSLVFARPNAICDIFAVRNGTGSGRLLYHRDFDYLEVRKLHMNLSECWQAMSSASDGTKVPRILVESAGDASSASSASSDTDGHSGEQTGSGGNRTGSANREAPKDVCASKRDIVVFKSQGYRLADGPTRRRQRAAVGEKERQLDKKDSSTKSTANEIMPKMMGQQSSETECIFSCLVNLAHGRSAFECLAATFDQVQGRCLLYGPGSAADGSVHLVPDPSFAHYEKGCIVDELVELCQGLPIIRYPQKTLLGFAIGSRRAGTLIECLELCWVHNNANTVKRRRKEEEGNGGNGGGKEEEALKCKSVVFFYEESGGGHNCMLNSESRDTAPAFFVDENEALVDYASFDGCFRAAVGDEEEAAQQLEEENGEEEDGDDGRDDNQPGERAVVMLKKGEKKKEQPKLLRLRPLPERRRRPKQPQHPHPQPKLVEVKKLMMNSSEKGIYFTKNAGRTPTTTSRAGMERRLQRLVDSEKNDQMERMRKMKMARRHGGQTKMPRTKEQQEEEEDEEGRRRRNRREIKWSGRRRR